MPMQSPRAAAGEGGVAICYSQPRAGAGTEWPVRAKQLGRRTACTYVHICCNKHCHSLLAWLCLHHNIQ